MKIKSFFTIIFGILVVFLSISVLGDEVNYTEEVRVTDRSIAERDAAFGKALEQILVKLTGNREVTKLPKMAAQRDNANVFIQSYTYVTHRDNEQEELFLQINFDPHTLQRLMGQTVAQVDQRTAVLVWLAVRGENKIITEDSGDLADALKNASAVANVRMILPSSESSDANALTIEDICAQNLEAVKAASQKYGTSSIVLGCLIKAPGQSWAGQWLLQTKDSRSNWGLNGANPNDLLTDAAQHLAQALGNTNQPKTLVLRIIGVSDLGQYAEVVKYLRQISPETNIALLSINSTEVRMNVVGQAGQQKLLVALNSQNQLTPEREHIDGVDLNYRWKKSE